MTFGHHGREPGRTGLVIRGFLSLPPGGWREALPSAIEHALSWPEPLRPTHLTVGETNRTRHALGTEGARRIAATNESGVYLHARGARVLVEKDRPPLVPGPDGVAVRVDLHREDDADIADVVEAVLADLASWPDLRLVCALACDEDELVQVHKVEVKTQRGVVEGYCGLNHRRWVPSVHWRNVWDHTWLHGHALDADMLPATWKVEHGDATGHLFVAPYRDREMWREAREEIDEWASHHEKVFSRGAVDRARPSSATELEAVAFLRPWR